MISTNVWGQLAMYSFQKRDWIRGTSISWLLILQVFK